MDHGLISFFDVKHCGFYSTKRNSPEHIEGSLEQVIHSFCEWVKDRDFSLTIPWDPNSHPKRTQIYCKSVAQDPTTKDTLLVLWKRFGDDSGRVSGISPDAKVGQDTSDSIKIDPKVKGQRAFLGQPMYYWIIPSLNVIATVKFGHSSASTKETCDYIKRCIDYRIDHPRKVTTENDVLRLGTGKAITYKTIKFMSEKDERMMRFKIFVSTKETKSDEVNARNLSNKISHIVVRDTISTEKRDDKDPLFKLWDKVSAARKYKKKIEVVEAASLSVSEVKDIISVHNEEYDPSNSWNNIGFKEEKNGATRWFDSYVSRESIRLPDLDNNKTYYSAETVLEKLTLNRNDILQQVVLNSENVEARIGKKGGIK